MAQKSAVGFTTIFLVLMVVASFSTLRDMILESRDQPYCPCAKNEDSYNRLPYVRRTVDTTLPNPRIASDTAMFTAHLQQWDDITAEVVRTRTAERLPPVRLTCRKLDVSGLSVSSFEMPYLSANPRAFVGAWIPGSRFATSRVYAINLAGAWLDDSDCSRALFHDCNLSNATLERSDMSDAMLVNSDVSGADFYGANMSHVRYQATGIPDVTKLHKTVGLNTMCYLGSPQGLVELRDALAKANMVKQAREVNFALRTWNRMLSGGVVGILEKVFVAVPVRYGETPFRPLALIAANIILFSLAYWYALSKSSRPSIYVGTISPETGKSDAPARPLLHLRASEGFVQAVLLSILFAFRIGWREFNIGAWLEQIYPEAREVRTRGWVRSAAGVQSLLSVYALVLCLLSVIKGFL